MCRQIGDDFRLSYAALWRALIFADVDGIRTHSAAMNAGDLYPLFASMLTLRPWERLQKRSFENLRTAGGDAVRSPSMHGQVQRVRIQRRCWPAPVMWSCGHHEPPLLGSRGGVLVGALLAPEATRPRKRSHSRCRNRLYIVCASMQPCGA